MLGPSILGSREVEKVVVDAALAVIGESFCCTAIVMVRSGSTSAPTDPAMGVAADGQASGMWTWSLPSWSSTGAAGYELHGRLWSHARSTRAESTPGPMSDGVRVEQSVVERLFDGFVWFGRLESDGSVAAAAYRQTPFTTQETDALHQSLVAVASVVSVPAGSGHGGSETGEAEDLSDAFAGAGRLSIDPSENADLGVEPMAVVGMGGNGGTANPSDDDDATTFIATLRVGRSLIATGRGASHVLAVARAAASSLQPQPEVVFAESVDIGRQTVTVALVVRSSEADLDKRVSRLGFALRPLGDINGGAAAVFAVMGWPDGRPPQTVGD